MFRKTALSFALVVLPIAGCSSDSSPAVAAEPTTAALAAERLDLETLPLPDGAEVGGYRRVADLGYTIKKSSKEAFEFVDKQLADRGWKQLPDAQENGDFMGADYQLDGYIVHVSVFPQQPGVAHVTLTHKGNVALGDIPVPESAEQLYAFTGIMMYKSPDDVETTAKACRDKMLAAGWSPYGGAGDTAYYRQNAVRADVRVMSAPAQNNATMISVSTTLLSVEMPAPTFADDFRYSDSTTAVSFDTDKTPQEVADYYREKLKPIGWKATTEKPVEIDWRKYTIFRNEGQEMITIETHDFEGRTRVKLDHQNTSEVATDELRQKIAAGEKAKYRDNKWQTVELPIPTPMKTEQLEDWAIRITTPSKEAFTTADAIAETLVADGWTAEPHLERPIFRTRHLSREDRVIHVLSIEPKKLKPWVAVVGVGGVILKNAN